MEYNNGDQSYCRFIYLLWHLTSLFIIVFGYFDEGLTFDYIFMSAVFLSMLILFYVIAFKYDYLFHYTYLFENRVEQKFLRRKKEISYQNIKYVYLIDTYVVLCKKKEVYIEEREYKLKERKGIIRKLKSNVFISVKSITNQRTVDNTGFLLILQEKCPDAEYIKIGKLPAVIEEKMYL